jgi:hypothetical protein
MSVLRLREVNLLAQGIVERGRAGIQSQDCALNIYPAL